MICPKNTDSILTIVFCKQTRKKYIIGESEIKQIMSESSTWKFIFSNAIPKRFSSIKVGSCIFLNLNSCKTKINNLQIYLDGLLKSQQISLPTYFSVANKPS